MGIYSEEGDVMAGRIRTIKPELLEDERTASLSHEEFRLFVGLILLADDHGNFRATPKMLDGAIFHTQESREGVARLLDGLARVSLVTLYRVRGQAYGHLRGWDKHQRVDHPSKPRVPQPTDEEAVQIQSLTDKAEPTLEPTPKASRDSREILAPDLRSPIPITDHGDGAKAPSEPSGSVIIMSKSDKAVQAGSADAVPSAPPPQPVTPQTVLAIVEPTKGQARHADAIFAAYLDGWRRNNGRGRAPVLDEKRKRLIAARLKEFDVECLKAAARGIWASSWHIAEGQTTLDLVMRDAAHVERFAALDPSQIPKRGEGPIFEEDDLRDAPPMRPSVLACSPRSDKTLDELIANWGKTPATMVTGTEN